MFLDDSSSRRSVAKFDSSLLTLDFKNLELLPPPRSYTQVGPLTCSFDCLYLGVSRTALCSCWLA